MSWMMQLYDVYEHNSHRVGIFEEKRNQRITLLPVAHVVKNAQIQINITLNGDFLNAMIIDNEKTIVPTTPDAESRTNNIKPHYLHDELPYVAGDYSIYSDDKKRDEYFKEYYKQMKDWANHQNAPKEVKAIFNYISKKRVVKDLIDEKIIPVDQNGKLILRNTTKDRPQIYNLITEGKIWKTFVRFNVISEYSLPVWENKNLFNNFIEYIYVSFNDLRGLCYVSGINNKVLTNKHSLGIQNLKSRAKLISANDNKDFTFRGRFKTSEQAVQISFDVSQKAHNALRWLIQRQGTNIDSRYFVVFGTESVNVPQAYEDGLEFLSQDIIEKSQNKVLTEEIVAAEIEKAMNGYKFNFKKEDLKNIIVISVDQTNKGRLAIVYYQQLNPERYINALLKWHKSCRWLQEVRDKKTNQLIRFIGSPSIHRIVETIYDKEKFIQRSKKINDRQKQELFTRILQCIINDKKIPDDIIKQIFNRVINPYSFKSKNQAIDYFRWNEAINIACALIIKQYESEGFRLGSIDESKNRDILFGRLLGVAEVMERRILKDREKNRATNATRYFNVFSQRPARTWQIIRKQLNPYFIQFADKMNFYAKLIQKIESKISVEQMNDKPLGPVFLLGYSSQIQELYTKKEENEDGSIAE